MLHCREERQIARDCKLNDVFTSIGPKFVQIESKSCMFVSNIGEIVACID
jgi:hypothetical protein